MPHSPLRAVFAPVGRLPGFHRALWQRAPLVVALVWVGVAALLAMVWIDRPLALALKANVLGEWKGFWSIVTDLGSGLPWYLLGLGGAAWCWLASSGTPFEDQWRLWRDRARAWLFLVATLAASGLLVTLLKLLVGRLRPVWLFREDAYGFAPLSFEWAANSFPSGHSQTIWAAMAALMILFPRHWPTFAALAVLVAASRLFITVHYLSDVLVGSAIGITAAILLARWLRGRGWVLRIGRPL